MTVSLSSDAGGLLYRRNYTGSVTAFSDSLERLSSRVRVTRATDDAVSVSLANQHRGRALALGQAARNAADAASAGAVADNALAEALEILAGVGTKAKAAAVEGISDTARQTLHNDAVALLKDFDATISAASYNGRALLTGSFINQEFQVGASSGEVLTLSFADSRARAAGTLRLNQLSPASATGAVSLSLVNRNTGQTLSLAGLTLAYDNTADNGMSAIAKAVNAHTSATGFSAVAVVESISTKAVQGGVTAENFAVNDVLIGPVVVQANDADGRLVNLINGTSDRHGVSASMVDSGRLRLYSADGRGIKVTGLSPVMAADDSEMSSFGYLKIFQPGPYALNDSGDITFSSNMLSIDSASSKSMKLADISLAGRNDAIDAGAVVEAAIDELNHLREQALSVQDQFGSARDAAAISQQFARLAGESVMEVDLNDETATFAKMKMLVLAGSFAMVQSNVRRQGPSDLLQGDISTSLQEFFATINGITGSIEGNAFFRRYAAEPVVVGPVVNQPSVE